MFRSGLIGSRRLCAGVLSLSLALGLAAPAGAYDQRTQQQRQNAQVAQIVGGLIALGVIAKVANDRKDEKDRRCRERRAAEAAAEHERQRQARLAAEHERQRQAQLAAERERQRQLEIAQAAAREIGRHRRPGDPIVELPRPGLGKGGGHGHAPAWNAQTIPARCVATVGTRRVVGAPCLQRQGWNAQLPRRCETEFFLGGRYRPGYLARCLERAGYRVP